MFQVVDFLGYLTLFSITFPNFLENCIWKIQNVESEKSSVLHRKEGLIYCDDEFPVST